MLQTRQLEFAYPRSPAFHFPDLLVEAGQQLLVLGPSGRGKTTFLHLLAGLLRPQSGEVRVADQVLGELSRRQLDRFRGRHIGLVFQRPPFVSTINGRQNLRLARYLAELPAEPQREQHLLDRLGIADVADRPPHRLSQGERQRLAIARAVVNRPRLLLADEPTSSLDDRRAEGVVELLEREAAEANSALVIVTHDQRLRHRFPNQVQL